jgi:ferric-dicitrate binding protein FerR (iron transport regulator)
MYNLSSAEETALLDRILQTNMREKLQRQKQRRLIWSAVACVAVFVVSVTYTLVLKEEVVTEDITKIAREMDIPSEASDEISLMLSDSRTIKSIKVNKRNAKIEHATDGTIRVDSQVVVAAESTAQSVKENIRNEYAQLVVPDGKHTTLILEDGSELWVNAGSRLIYPIVFSDKKREIYIDGEIYLKVVPDKQRPFVVKTNKMDVLVHGTSFNVCAYQSDETQEVVLVEGSVTIKAGINEQRLSPNELFTYANGRGAVMQVNTDDYTLWRYGLYRFNRSPLSAILERFSRYYARHIECDPEVSTLTFSGKLDMQEPLESLLEVISYTAPVAFSCDDGSYHVHLK